MYRIESVTPERALVDALEQHLLTVYDDTVHDLLFVDMLTKALERFGRATLRGVALKVLVAVACRLHRNGEVATAPFGHPPHPDPDIVNAHAAAIEAARAVPPVGCRSRSAALKSLDVAAEQHGWDWYVLLMASSVVANMLSVLEEPQLDDLDRGWTEHFVAELRTEVYGGGA